VSQKTGKNLDNEVNYMLATRVSMEKTYSYIDLFAGCGGLSLGLHNAGWDGIFAIEKAEDAFKTLEHNLIEKHKHFSWVDWLPQKHLDIESVIRKYKNELKSLRGTVDMVTGGPPCQGFSVAGRRHESDGRNTLIKSYIRFIKLVEPKILFFENVRGFTLEFKKNREKGRIYSEYVLRELTKAGYHVFGQLVNFGDFGIPQNRTRFILVGLHKNLAHANIQMAKRFFSLLTENRTDFLKRLSLPQRPVLNDAIEDLLKENGVFRLAESMKFLMGKYSFPKGAYQRFMRRNMKANVPDSHRFANHTETIEARLRYLLENAEKNKDLSHELREKFGIKKHTLVPLGIDSPSRTLTSNPDDLIHYSEPRFLTVREYARIQSFPDDFEFKGKYTTGGLRRRIDVPRYTQIGNAVPPLFAEQSGLTLKQLLDGC